MKLEFFNRANTTGSGAGQARINFAFNGAIVITKEAAKILGLKTGSLVEFVFDKETKQWYIINSVNPTAFIIRDYKGTQGLTFHSGDICKKVWLDFSAVKSSVKAIVTDAHILVNGQALYPLQMTHKTAKP